MKTKILIYQQQLLGYIPEKDINYIKSIKPDFICLPEYFFHPEIISYSNSINYIKNLSKIFNGIIIGGTTVLNENEKKFNTCYIFEKGNELGFYKKINLYYREQGIITPGDVFKVFATGNLKIGILICADALYENSWIEMSKLKPDIIFIPTFSPYKTENANDKFLRDEKIYVNGAKKTNAIIVKVCSIGMFKDTKLQGRSLIASPNGILWRVLPEDEDKSVIKSIETDITCKSSE